MWLKDGTWNHQFSDLYILDKSVKTCGVHCQNRPCFLVNGILLVHIGRYHPVKARWNSKKDQNDHINPALQHNSRLQGYKAAMSSGKVLRFCRAPRFHNCGFPGLQGCRFREFQGSRVLDYQGSGVSRFQASRFQTCKGLGLIQQRNHQSNANKNPKQNRVAEIYFKEHSVSSMIHTRTSTLQFRKVQGSKLFARLSVSRQRAKL